MNPPPQSPPSSSPQSRPASPGVEPLDWLMLALAIVSIGLLVYESLWPIDEATRRMVATLDYVICGLFALEFLWRWRRAGWDWGYVRRNWYEVLGMIPLQQPALRGFRLFRVLRIAILLSRFGMAADRAFGDEFTYRLVRHFKRGIVDSISGAVTISVLDQVSDVLAKGTYSRNVSRALLENQQELRAMISEKLRQDRHAGALSKLPFYNDVVGLAVDASLRVVEQILMDRRTDALVADIIRENLQQIRAAVAQQEQDAEVREHLHRTDPFARRTQPPAE